MSEPEVGWDQPEVIGDARRIGALPPPRPGIASLDGDGSLVPGQILSAPTSGRLRQLPPPRYVPDAVPLDVDELERIAARAGQRRRHLRCAPESSTASLLGLDAPELAPPTGMMLPPSGLRPAAPAAAPTVATVPPSPPVQPSIEPPLVPEPVAAFVPAPPTETKTDTMTAAPERDKPARQRRPGVLAGSVAAFAVVSLLTAAWAQQRRRTDTTVRTASVAASASTPAPVTSAAPLSAAPATEAPIASSAPTTVAAPVTVATDAPTTAAPVTSVTTTATTAAPPTVATTSPAPSVPPSVLGTTLLNRELLDALGTGTLPGGKPWPIATFSDGRLVVTGAVPDRATADAMVRAAASLASAELVDDRLTVDTETPAVRYLLVRLFDNPVFDRGYTSLRKDAQPVFELWAKRLRDQPSAMLVLVAHGDGTSTSLAATRARNAKDRMISVGLASADQVEAQTSAGDATGPRLDFANPVG